MPSKILVADDSPTLLKIIESFLSQEGYEIITAQDGIEALQKIYQENPSLIILDVMMPKMTGYQVCRILKHDKETQNIPIILLTALEQQKDKFWGLKTGADKYIPKTSEFTQVLIPEIRRLLLEKFNDLPRAETLSHRKADTSEIISLVNSLLDKQLFELTIINEVNNLSIFTYDYKRLIKEFFLLVGQLIRYELGWIFLVDEKENELLICTSIEINKTLIRQLQEKIAEEIKGKVQVSLFPAPKTDIIFDKDKYNKEETCDSIDKIESYFSKDLYVRNICVGSFGMADRTANRFDDEISHACDLVLNQGLILIDNAKLYSKTQELAITDGLTGLYNRHYFQKQLAKEFNRAERYNHCVSLIMLDIDHFKHFNDVYGHQAGDVIMKELSHLLQSNIRNVDTAARYGGEEFIIIVPENCLESSVEMAKKLCKLIEKYDFSIKSKYPEEKITVSVGVASFPDDAKNETKLLAKVDEMLYQAKETGRNRVCSGILEK